MVRWMKVGMQISNTECHIPHKPIKYHIVGENGNSAKSRSKLWEVFPRPNTHINFAKMLFFKGFPIFLSSGAGPRLVACIEYALIPLGQRAYGQSSHIVGGHKASDCGV